jgi:membrane protein
MLSRKSSWRVIRRVVSASQEDEIFARAAQLGFLALLALFPSILGITAIIGMLPPQVVSPRVMPYAQEVLPAESLSLVEGYLDQMAAGSGGKVVSASILGALWAASWGMMAIMASLNVVFGVPETRPFWKTVAIALLLTVGAAAFVLTSLSMILAGEQFTRWIINVTGFSGWGKPVWSLVRWPLVLVLLLMAVDLIYFWAPNTHQAWRWVTPGAIFAVLLWILFSLGFKYYVDHFINYNVVYGPLTGVIILMMWLYMCGLTLLLGGELNAALDSHSASSRSSSGAHTSLDDPASPDVHQGASSLRDR